MTPTPKKPNESARTLWLTPNAYGKMYRQLMMLISSAGFDGKIEVMPCTELKEAQELCRELVKLLEGKHDDCNYLAYGHCNKCGKNTNHIALTKARETMKGWGK